MLLPNAIKRRSLEKMIFACQDIIVNDPEISQESRDKIRDYIDKKIDKMKKELRDLNEPKNGTKSNRSKLTIDYSKLEENKTS